MSDAGRNGFFGTSPFRRPEPQGGQTGPQRDAWNNPIKETPPNNSGDNKDDKNKNIDPNNTGIDDKTIDNIWEDVKRENSHQPDNSDKGGGGSGNNAPPDPQKQMSDYLKSVGLDPMALSDAEKEELKNGNFDNFIAKINDRTVQAHVKALSGSRAMIEDAIKKGVAEAINTTRSQEAGVRNVDAMERALPFTKDKVIGPVAQSVLQRFLNKGMNTEDAIKGVKQYFEYTAGKISPNVSVNKNLNGHFRTPGDSDTGENDWLKVLRPNG